MDKKEIAIRRGSGGIVKGSQRLNHKELFFNLKKETPYDESGITVEFGYITETDKMFSRILSLTFDEVFAISSFLKEHVKQERFLKKTRAVDHIIVYDPFFNSITRGLKLDSLKFHSFQIIASSKQIKFYRYKNRVFSDLDWFSPYKETHKIPCKIYSLSSTDLIKIVDAYKFRAANNILIDYSILKKELPLNNGFNEASYITMDPSIREFNNSKIELIDKIDKQLKEEILNGYKSQMYPSSYVDLIEKELDNN